LQRNSDNHWDEVENVPLSLWILHAVYFLRYLHPFFSKYAIYFARFLQPTFFSRLTYVNTAISFFYDLSIFGEQKGVYFVLLQGVRVR
jgi:hypothetical protein